MDAKRLEREIHKNPFDTFMDFHVEKAESESMILTFENKGSKWDNPMVPCTAVSSIPWPIRRWRLPVLSVAKPSSHWTWA